MRAVALAVLLTSPVVVPPAHAVARPHVEVGVVSWVNGGRYFALVHCRLFAEEQPARTDVYCRVDTLAPVWSWSPAPVNVTTWAGDASPGTVVCAGGTATYRDLSVVSATEACTALPVL